MLSAHQALAGFPRAASREEGAVAPDERVVLAVDTSAAHCAAALLFADGRVLDREEAMATGQAERLMPFLDELLSEAGLDWGDLSLLAVGTGPGNFTGVRISVAAVRGLALGLGIPALGVTRLEALAHGLPRPLTVIEDARRDEAYIQDFTQAGPGLPALRPLRGIHLTGAVTGTGAALLGLIPLAPPQPLTVAIARIAAERAGTGAPLPRPAPFYLRGADAAPPADPPPVILP